MQPVGKKKTETGLKRQKEKEKEAMKQSLPYFAYCLQFSLRVFWSFNGASFYNFAFLASFVHVC